MIDVVVCVCGLVLLVVFCKQKTAYEMRISDWSSDVCSSDLFDPNINVEDQRGRGGGGFGGGGGGLLFSLLPLIGSRFGCGGIAVVLILFAVFGGLGNLGNLGGMLGGGGSAPTTRIAAPGSGGSGSPAQQA